MTDTDKAPKMRTIILTDRPPVRIIEGNWPIIAEGGMYDYRGAVHSPDKTWDIEISVRQHRHDGRAIVCGVYIHQDYIRGYDIELQRAGVLVDPGSNISDAIMGVGWQLIDRIQDQEMFPHVRRVVDECISNLPAEDLG